MPHEAADMRRLGGRVALSTGQAIQIDGGLLLQTDLAGVAPLR